MASRSGTAGGAGEGAFLRIVWPFAIAETLVWAAYYYSFPALLPAWEADLGFSKTTLTGAFTVSLVVSAVMSPVAGRFIDRGYGRSVFAGGAVLASALLVILATVTEVWAFYAVWIGIGVAMSGSLYDACFAILTHCMAGRARRAITLVSLVAGFAGTVSFPSAHVLTGLWGWRVAVLVFAGVVLVICVPLVLYGCHHAARRAQGVALRPSINTRQAMGATRTWAFWLIGLGFTLLALDHGLIISHLLPILADRGLSADLAVLAASMIGPMQVVGRLLMMAVERHVTTLTICLACFASMTVAGAALYLSPAVLVLVALFVVLQGAGAGVLSIVRPAVVAELLGRKDFGVTAGLLAMGFMAGSALAPITASLVWGVGGYDLVLVLTIIAPLLGAASLVGAWRFRPAKRN